MAFAGLLFVTFADTALRPWLPGLLWFDRAPPPLPLLTAFYLGSHAYRATRPLFLAVLLGAMQDCFSVAPLGYFAFLFGLAALLARGLNRYLHADSGAAFAVLSLFCGLGYAFCALLLAVLAGGNPHAAGFGDSLLSALTGALVAPLVWRMWEASGLFREALRVRSYGLEHMLR